MKPTMQSFLPVCNVANSSAPKTHEVRGRNEKDWFMPWSPFPAGALSRPNDNQISQVFDTFGFASYPALRARSSQKKSSV